MVIDGPRMSDISEQEEARCLWEFVQSCFDDCRPILGAHLWTHSPKRLMENPLLGRTLARLSETGIPAALQVTITGLGGTLLEPGIEPTEEAFACLDRLLESKWVQPHRLCLRIDPIQAWEGPALRIGNPGLIDGLMDRARRTGIERIRVSLLSYRRYAAKILPRLAARNLRVLPVASEEVGPVLLDWRARALDVRTCATDLTGFGIPAGSCFDFEWVTGARPEGEPRAVAPRRGCLCEYPESVRIWKVPRRSSCAGRCLACYAQEHL